MQLNTIYNCDCLTGLLDLPDECIDSCVTSPPYYGLRDYGVDGQIGLEATPEEYISRLVEVFREVHRVLKSDGTLWVVIGDSYAGGNNGAANYPENAKKYKQGSNRGSMEALTSFKYKTSCKRRDLIGIPWMLAFALRDEVGFYLRQDIIWSKPNPMPESVTNRCTRSHEYIFLLSKSEKYYFNHEAMLEEAVKAAVNGKNTSTRYGGNKYTATPNKFERTKSGNAYNYTGKRNKRDVWTVSTKPTKEEHFATFPPDLIEPCIRSGTPVGGIVLDPFMGSGTTAMVALSCNRFYVGFELNQEFIEIAKKKTQVTPSLF